MQGHCNCDQSVCTHAGTRVTDACLRGADAKDERPVRQALLLPVRCVRFQLILEVEEYRQVEVIDASPAHGAMLSQGDVQHHNSCSLCNSLQPTSQSHLAAPSRRSQGFRLGIGLSGPSDQAVQRHFQGHSRIEPAAVLSLPILQDVGVYISVKMQGVTCRPC